MRREKRYGIALTLVAMIGGLALAGTETAGTSTTRPSAAPPITLLILPFENLNSESPDSWTAAAAQRSLVDNLKNVPGIMILTGDTVPSDAQSAIAIGQQHESRYVIRGTLQALPRQLRFSGEVLDVSSGQALATLKATGTADDLFDLEETLARQARRAFRSPVAISTAANKSSSESENAAPPIINPGGPLRLNYGSTTDGAPSANASGLNAYCQSATANERYATEYNRYKTNMGAFDGSYWGGYWGGYYGYPYYGFGFGFGTYGVSIYGTSHH